jgi:hypothetical protein
MIIQRPFWQNLIEKAWKKRNIIWLMGVRRVGKTNLCLSLSDIEYFDCERPQVRRLVEDPEGKNYIVTSNIDVSFERQHENITLSFINTKQLMKELLEAGVTSLI